ncbi:unnamed protein product [Urochloa humidicola]
MPPPSPSPAGCRKKPTTSPDWAALPHDILYSIFLLLGQREIMQGVEFVCTAWRRVAVGEPALWRRVGVVKFIFPLISPVERRMRSMVLAAIDRGAGQSVAFSGPLDDELLLHLVERAPLLKSIYITQLAASNKVLNTAQKKLPLLEDLGILNIRRWVITWCDNEKLLESVCQACPHLNKLILSNINFGMDTDSNDNGKGHYCETYEIPPMHQLRSIKLLDCDLTTKALSAILDSCPLLEYLEVTGTFYATVDEQLQVKCDRVKNLILPNDFVEDEKDDIMWDICEMEGDLTFITPRKKKVLRYNMADLGAESSLIWS